LEKGDELVGISAAKDLNYTPHNFVDKFIKKTSFALPIMKLEEKLMGLLPEQYQPLMTQTGVVMDIWGVAIKK
jgi:hypothetical protein